MAESAKPSIGILASLRRIASTLAGVAQNRLELFLVEFEEERNHLLRVFIQALVALFLFGLSFLAINVAIVVWLWETHRQVALLGMAALYGLLGVLVARRLALTMQSWESFPATLDQLKKDRECLRPPE
jgi:uncharacterized membrane protein YqjE